MEVEKTFLCIRLLLDGPGVGLEGPDECWGMVMDEVEVEGVGDMVRERLD